MTATLPHTPVVSAGKRVKFSTVQLDQLAISSTRGDFGAANKVMKARVEAYNLGTLDDAALLAEIDSLPLQLRRWFVESPAKQGPPKKSSDPLKNAGADYTWHHSEVTGQLELIDTATHASVNHLGGSRLWGNTLAANANDGKLVRSDRWEATRRLRAARHRNYDRGIYIAF